MSPVNVSVKAGKFAISLFLGSELDVLVALLSCSKNFSSFLSLWARLQRCHLYNETSRGACGPFHSCFFF